MLMLFYFFMEVNGLLTDDEKKTAPAKTGGNTHKLKRKL